MYRQISSVNFADQNTGRIYLRVVPGGPSRLIENCLSRRRRTPIHAPACLPRRRRYLIARYRAQIGRSISAISLVPTMHIPSVAGRLRLSGDTGHATQGLTHQVNVRSCANPLRCTSGKSAPLCPRASDALHQDSITAPVPAPCRPSHHLPSTPKGQRLRRLRAL
jgi:hypothetical protein